MSIFLLHPAISGTAIAGEMKLPPVRKIPGLTAEDKFPGGCIDCHINMPDIKQDERISTLMTRWNKGVEAKLLEKVRAVSSSDINFKGVHPMEAASLKNIPADCISCHSKNPKTAPPLAPLLHAIHLTGGSDNHFLTIFQGECTHCHKMDAVKGVWIMPSGAEK